MTPEACVDGDEKGKILIDSRDKNEYTVAKLKDGHCWMTENLRIINQTISSADSDMVSGSFTIPASNISGFTSSDQNEPKAYYQAPYGSYYNFYTATAGKGNADVTSGNVENSSICPKGWMLPPNDGNISYARLLSGLTKGTDITVLPYSFVNGGYVANSSLPNTGSTGSYWSSTAIDANNAYFLSFNSSNVNPSNGSARYPGRSVRCVAR